MPTALQGEAALIADLVKRYRVCWEVWPEDIFVKDEKRQVGFSLELYGTHEPSVEHPTAGCPDCIPVFAALQKIAAYIVPKEKRPSISAHQFTKSKFTTEHFTIRQSAGTVLNWSCRSRSFTERGSIFLPMNARYGA